MNLNGEEKRIQQLFREMSSDERRRAPEFASVLAAPGKARLRGGSRSLRLAMAVAMIFAGLLVAAALILTPSKPQGLAESTQAQEPVSKPESPDGVEPSQRNLQAPTPALLPKRASRRRTDRTTLVMKSLFAWRSPTASLLKTPGDELLRSLPRLGESLKTIRTYTPDQFN